MVNYVCSVLLGCLLGLKVHGFVQRSFYLGKKAHHDSRQIAMRDATIVWYRACDLRVHDHGGLHSALSSGAPVIPFFVFDSKVIAADGPVGAAYIYYAVDNLRKKLRNLGSDLVVRNGSSVEAMIDFISETKANAVCYFDSPISNLKDEAESVKRVLSNTTVFIPWKMQLRGDVPLPENVFWTYKSFIAATMQLPIKALLPTPEFLPSIPSQIESGNMPDIHEVVNSLCTGKFSEILKNASPPFGTHTVCNPGFGESSSLELLNRYVMEGEIEFGKAYFKQELCDYFDKREVTQDRIGSILGKPGLESAAVKRILDSKGPAGLAPGEIFARAFSMALSLGCLSPKRLLCARSKGYAPNYISVQRPAKCWVSTIAYANEWHQLLASRDLLENKNLPYTVKYWRWNGWLCRYAEGGLINDSNAPTLVMVHGFGASIDQWKRCFSELNCTHRLFALDLLGFGHSSKPPLSYSQYTWSDVVRDFGLQIVKTPFFLAGNSIGGYTCMGTASSNPSICEGLVLLNSAGRLLTTSEFEAEKEKFGGCTVAEATLLQTLPEYTAPPNLVLGLISSVIFSGLQGRIEKICKSLYPTRPERVDDGLADDILRDSMDPGALGIFNAGAKLPFSSSVNEMLGEFGGAVLVAQGLLDPLNDAKKRSEQFKEAYSLIEVVPIQGGHCPQHEMAEEVCAAISTFTGKYSRNESNLSKISAES